MFPRLQADSSSVACSQDSTCPVSTTTSHQPIKVALVWLASGMPEAHLALPPNMVCSQEFPQPKPIPTIAQAGKPKWPNVACSWVSPLPIPTPVPALTSPPRLLEACCGPHTACSPESLWPIPIEVSASAGLPKTLSTYGLKKRTS